MSVINFKKPNVKTKAELRTENLNKALTVMKTLIDAFDLAVQNPYYILSHLRMPVPNMTMAQILVERVYSSYDIYIDELRDIYDQDEPYSETAIDDFIRTYTPYWEKLQPDNIEKGDEVCVSITVEEEGERDVLCFVIKYSPYPVIIDFILAGVSAYTIMGENLFKELMGLTSSEFGPRRIELFSKATNVKYVALAEKVFKQESKWNWN